MELEGNRFSTWQRMPQWSDLGIRLRDFVAFMAAYGLLRAVFLVVGVNLLMDYPDTFDWIILIIAFGYFIIMMVFVGVFVKVERKRGVKTRQSLLPEMPDPDAQIALLHLGGSQSMSMPAWGYVYFDQGQLVFTSRSFNCRFNPSDEIATKERFSIRFQYNTPVGKRTCRLRFGCLDMLKFRSFRLGFEGMREKLDAWRKESPTESSLYPPLKSALLEFPRNYLTVRVPVAIVLMVTILSISQWLMVFPLERRFHHSLGYPMSEVIMVGTRCFVGAYLVALAIGYVVRRMKRSYNSRVENAVG